MLPSGKPTWQVCMGMKKIKGGMGGEAGPKYKPICSLFTIMEFITDRQCPAQEVSFFIAYFL